jgi:hypothetical protein
VHTQPKSAGHENLPLQYLRSYPRSSRELVLLAPAGFVPSKFFRRQEYESERRRDLLAELQTLRGKVYLQDGAITPREITAGRHQAATDADSWHLLTLDEYGRVCGCARYKEHPREVGFGAMLVAGAALAACPYWGSKLASAIETELASVRRLGLSCVELGGWALCDRIRGSSDALRMVLTTYSLAQVLGGGLGITTATHRNGSATILRKIGALRLEHGEEELPSYQDPRYGCEMEILRFHFWEPNPRYRSWIEEIKGELSQIRVIADKPANARWNFPSAFEAEANWSGFEARLAS